MTLSDSQFAAAHRMYGDADALRWHIAYLSDKITTKADALRMSKEIGRGTDTVANLAYAHRLFALLVRRAWLAGQTSEPIRKLRRRYPYTRWMTVYRKWLAYEFPLDEAQDWLENFDGGNDAMSAEIENKHGLPEWERQAFGMYSLAGKLLEGSYGVPDRLRNAAEKFAAEYRTWETGK